VLSPCHAGRTRFCLITDTSFNEYCYEEKLVVGVSIKSCIMMITCRRE
jgi:hypothetical protein